MPRLLVVAIPILSCLLLTSGPTENPQGASFNDPFDGEGWETDLDRARANAKTSGQPLLIVFRCPP